MVMGCWRGLERSVIRIIADSKDDKMLDAFAALALLVVHLRSHSQ